MDESGEAQYGKTIERRPHFLRSCVLIRENQLAVVEASVQKLCEGLPISSQAFDNCRFSAKDMYWRTRDWQEFKDNPEPPIDGLVGMAEIIDKYDLSISFAHINKPQILKSYKDPMKPAVLTFLQCGHIVERWMYQHAPDQRWMPCVGTSDYDRNVRNAFDDCRKYGSPIRSGVRWKRVCDTVGFVSPMTSHLFLIADFCAFMFGRKQQGKKDYLTGLYDHLKPRIWNPWVFSPRS
jgi:hypothetical protein